MKLILYLLVLVFLGISCSSVPTSSSDIFVKNDNFSIISNKDLHKINFYRDRIYSRTGKYFTLNKFKMNIPKNVKNFYYTENLFVFEYENDQYLFIKSNLKNEKSLSTKWIKNEDINSVYINTFDLMIDPLNEKEIIPKSNLDNIIYSNNLVEITLVNFTKEYKEKFIPYLESFKPL